MVVGPKFLRELRMLPESSLNATAALVDSVLGSYSGVDILLNGHLSSDICRAPLTKNMRRIATTLTEYQSADPTFSKYSSSNGR